MTTRLYTFWISHFSEKARWGLAFEGIALKEKALLPGLHVLTTRRIAPRQQVPLLVHQGEVIQGSGAILDAIPRVFGKFRLQPWLKTDQRNEPQETEARRLEELADRGFGRAIQAYGYDALLKDREKIMEAWSFGGPWWSHAFYKLTFGGMERAVRKGYCRSPEYVEESRDRFLKAFDETDAILAKQPYLLGDSPTRPDIAVAALLCPVVRPQEHPLPWPVYPEPLESFCERLKERPTFRFVERMYRDHRAPASL